MRRVLEPSLASHRGDLCQPPASGGGGAVRRCAACGGGSTPMFLQPPASAGSPGRQATWEGEQGGDGHMSFLSLLSDAFREGGVCVYERGEERETERQRQAHTHRDRGRGRIRYLLSLSPSVSFEVCVWSTRPSPLSRSAGSITGSLGPSLPSLGPSLPFAPILSLCSARLLATPKLTAPLLLRRHTSTWLLLCGHRSQPLRSPWPRS